VDFRKQPSFYSIFTLVLIFAVLLSLIISSLFFMNHYLICGSDFGSFYMGIRMLLSDVRSLVYERSTQSYFQGQVLKLCSNVNFLYRNPPTLALFFLPFLFTSLDTGYRLFAIFNIFLLLASLFLLQKSLDSKNTLFAYLLALSFLPAIATIVLGQVTILILFLFVIVFKFLKEKRFLSVGILLSFLLNKPQYLTFLPFSLLLIKNKPKFFKGFFLGSLIIFIIAVYMVGINGLLRYPFFLVKTENVQNVSRVTGFISFVSFLYFLGFSPLWVYLLNGIFYFFVFFLMSKRKKRLNLNASFSSSVLFTVAFTPHAWGQDLLIVLIPLVFLLNEIIDGKKSYILIFLLLYFSFVFRYFTNFPFLTSFLLIGIGVWFLRNFKKGFS